MTLAPAIDPPPESSNLGAVIRDARERRGMRQTDLAAAIHVGLSSVSGWERGTQSPSAAVLPLLAQALGVTLTVDADGFQTLDPTPAVDPAPEPAPAPQVVVVVAGTAEAMREALDRLGVPRAQ
jgi:transcriptional regulator with XRE-family HTH domain